MNIHNLSLKNSILNTFVSEIRNIHVQNDKMRFRRNIERIGEILGYEMSQLLNYKITTFETPLGSCDMRTMDNDIVLCSILRAGIPLHNGLLNYFDASENAFISAYRHHLQNSKSFEIIVEYASCPSLTNKTLILADPMLATGQSIVAAFNALKPYGLPKEIHLVSVIGSTQGIDYANKHFDASSHLWIAAIDEKLNDAGYIIPGLGDVGDLAFGGKLQK